MAEQVVPFEGGWLQVRNRSGQANKPTIRIRRSGDLGLSAQFVRFANIGERTRASVYLSRDGFRLALKFHDDEMDETSFLLCKDGGSGHRRMAHGRVIQCSTLKSRSRTVEKLSGLSDQDRTFIARKDVHGMFVIDLTPSFEMRFAHRGELSQSETGIYRYLLDGQIVYIGRGALLERFGSSERKNWEFDIIEYSVLNNVELEVKWESYWLSSFREARGRLPIYNRIGGVVVPPEASVG